MQSNKMNSSQKSLQMQDLMLNTSNDGLCCLQAASESQLSNSIENLKITQLSSINAKLLSLYEIGQQQDISGMGRLLQLGFGLQQSGIGKCMMHIENRLKILNEAKDRRTVFLAFIFTIFLFFIAIVILFITINMAANSSIIQSFNSAQFLKLSKISPVDDQLLYSFSGEQQILSTRHRYSSVCRLKQNSSFFSVASTSFTTLSIILFPLIWVAIVVEIQKKLIQNFEVWNMSPEEIRRIYGFRILNRKYISYDHPSKPVLFRILQISSTIIINCLDIQLSILALSVVVFTPLRMIFC